MKTRARYSLDANTLVDDVDTSDVLAITSIVQDSGRAITFDGTGGVLNFDTNQFNDLAVGESETLTFTYTADDQEGQANSTNTGQITVVVEGRNDQPTAAVAAETTDEDAGTFSLDANTLVNDVDASDVLAITSIVQDSGRAITFDGTGGVLNFDTNQFNDLAVGESETLTFTYTVDDQEGQANSTNTGQITVVVEGRNDQPTAADAADTTDEDAGTYSLDANTLVDDVDTSDVLAITSIVQDSGRAITFDGTGGVLNFDTNQFNDLAVGESETLTFTYTVDDLEGQANSTNTGQITVVVEGRNDQPVITGLESNHENACLSATDGQVTIGGTFADVDVSDTHVITVDWGDGLSETLPGSFVDQAGDSFSAMHAYASGGIFAVRVTATDSSGETSLTAESTAAVTGVGLVHRTLYVVGTAGKDDVKLKSKDGGDTVEVETKLDQGKKEKTEFLTDDIDLIVIHLCDGDDKADVDQKIEISTQIYGGAGKDDLKGGSGNDLLDGGPGEDDLDGRDGDDQLFGGEDDDKLDGGKGSDFLSGGGGDDDLKGGSDGDVDEGRDDILIGGDGDDKLDAGKGFNLLVGGRGDDDLKAKHSGGNGSPGSILIAGWTSHDEAADAASAFRSILRDEWISRWDQGDDYDQIVDDLVAAGSSLEAGQRVFGDSLKDKLEGSSQSRDLFFADLDGLDELKGNQGDRIIQVG